MLLAFYFKYRKTNVVTTEQYNCYWWNLKPLQFLVAQGHSEAVINYILNDKLKSHNYLGKANGFLK
jgi:hypothetical protein